MSLDSAMCINVCTYVKFFLLAKTTLLVDINYFTAIKVINFLIVVTNEKRADSSKEDCEKPQELKVSKRAFFCVGPF